MKFKHNLPFERITLNDIGQRLSQYGMLNLESNTCGLFLCEQGMTRLMINNQTCELHAGDVYIHIPSNFVHVIDRSDDIQGIILKTTLDIVLPFVNKINSRNLTSLHLSPCFQLTPAQRTTIEKFTTFITFRRDALVQCDNEDIAEVLRQQLIALSEAYVFELISYYFLAHDNAPKPANRRSTVFQNFMITLTRHFKQQRSITFYAQAQHLSVRYFSALVKKESGISATKWIAEYVISYSRQLLSYSDLSIKQITQELCFPDQSSFGKFFKQHTGLSPKTFRNQSQGQE